MVSEWVVPADSDPGIIAGLFLIPRDSDPGIIAGLLFPGKEFLVFYFFNMNSNK